MPRWPPESAGFSTAGTPTVGSRARAFGERPNGSERRLRHAFFGEGAAHHDLVPHPVRNVESRSTAGRALGHRGHDGHCAVGRHRERAVDRVSAGHLGDRLDSVKSTASATSASWSPGASGLRSTATTRTPSGACAIARRWWRPAPTKRTVFTPGDADRRSPGMARRSWRRRARGRQRDSSERSRTCRR